MTTYKYPFAYCSLLSIMLLVVGTMLLSSCKVTDALPEGEQLFVGIQDIKYTNVPLIKKKKAKTDSTGVITAVANAAENIQHILSGKNNNQILTTTSPKTDKGLTKEAIKLEKINNEIIKSAINTAKDELDAVLESRPNNSLFGSSKYHSPIQLGLWTYAAFHNKKSGIGKWLFKVFATEPVLVSNVAPETRSKIAQNTLSNYGFFKSNVQYDIINLSNPKKAKLSYDIEMGPLTRLGKVTYKGYTPLEDSLLRETFAQRLVKEGNAFNVISLSDERKRIGDLFRNNGYYYWRDEYTIFKADTTISPNTAVIEVTPVQQNKTDYNKINKQWRMGKTYITMLNNSENMLDASKVGKNFVFNYSGKRMPVRAFMWRHAITHSSGKLFRSSDQLQTMEKLNLMGIFRQLEINYLPHDTTSRCDTLDVYVKAIMDKPYSSNLEMNLGFKSNQQVGPGLSYSLDKKNAFHGGEKISFKIYGAYEWQLTSGTKSGNSALNSFELGSELSFKFPRLFIPFIPQRKLRIPAETKYSADADWRKRTSFFTLLNVGLSTTYSWHRYSTTQHEMMPMRLEFDRIFRKSQAFDSIMSANPALYISMRNQFIPSMSYSFTYASAPKHRNPIWLQLTAKESGNLLSGFYAAAGKTFKQTDKKFLGSPFAQFFKATAEIHSLTPLNSRFKLATRFYAGAIWSYGNSTRAPYSEQFYIGGANSVRGFTVRTIGPGSFRASNSKYSYIDQTGDIRLEANAELRYKIVGDIYGAVFLDAGNVWLMRKDAMRPGGQLTAKNLKNIAVSTGTGIRYDLDFLILRLDLGVALHAPYQTSKSGFFNMPKFKDTLNWHFAIGYPF